MIKDDCRLERKRVGSFENVTLWKKRKLPGCGSVWVLSASRYENYEPTNPTLLHALRRLGFASVALALLLYSGCVSACICDGRCSCWCDACGHRSCDCPRFANMVK